MKEFWMNSECLGVVLGAELAMVAHETSKSLTLDGFAHRKYYQRDRMGPDTSKQGYVMCG
jgi:hypothetical protein